MATSVLCDAATDQRVALGGDHDSALPRGFKRGADLLAASQLVAAGVFSTAALVMAEPFLSARRALAADVPRRWGPIVGLALLAGWGTWLLMAHVTLVETAP